MLRSGIPPSGSATAPSGFQIKPLNTQLRNHSVMIHIPAKAMINTKGLSLPIHQPPRAVSAG
mgnify:CR=1 FL=1